MKTWINSKGYLYIKPEIPLEEYAYLLLDLCQ